MRAYEYKSIQFFAITFLISSVISFAAAYISFQNTMQHLLLPLILGSMSGPSIAACIMLVQSKNQNLWTDFYSRLRFDNMKIPFILGVLLFVPSLIACAIILSCLFGQSLDQFTVSGQVSDQALNGFNCIGILITLLLSSSLEEIGWRGYGIDSLRSRYNLWQTSLIFATLWSAWHIPAFFINNGYFQQELWNLGYMHVVIYFASLYLLTILINWVYVENNRSILIAILFHMVINFSYSLFHLQLPTKIINMLLLWVVAGIVVMKNKRLFFTLPKKLL